MVGKNFHYFPLLSVFYFLLYLFIFFPPRLCVRLDSCRRRHLRQSASHGGGAPNGLGALVAAPPPLVLTTVHRCRPPCGLPSWLHSASLGPHGPRRGKRVPSPSVVRWRHGAEKNQYFYIRGVLVACVTGFSRAPYVEHLPLIMFD